MDKYLIKIPRVPTEKKNAKKALPKQKQVTIESLSRVVVVEHIKRAKAVLAIENQTVDQILSSLKELDSCTPSKEVLLETKIGHVVNKLRKHEDKNVQELSRQILKRWKVFYRELKSRQPIEVRCDLKTEQFRKKARKLLSDALSTDDWSPLVESIERSAYLKYERSTSNAYRKLIRVLCIKLKNTSELRNKVLNNILNAEELFKEVT